LWIVRGGRVAGEEPGEEAETPQKTCRVCHLPYEGDECPWCKSEREQASAVVEDRGRRRGRRFEEYLGGDQDD
jgi:hypothetical protein